jgi:hypothetical protein
LQDIHGYTNRSSTIERSCDIDRSDDVDKLGNSQYSLEHTFEELYNGPNVEPVDNLGFFPMDIRLLEVSDFFFPPWTEQSPPSNENPPLSVPTMPTNQYPTPESHSDGPCQCTTQALSLLESVVHHDTLSTLSSVPIDLSLNKRALIRCKNLLGCPHCISTSTFITLLILLCQQIISSYENIIAKFCNQVNKIHPDNQFTARGDSVDELHVRVQARIHERVGAEGGVMVNDLATGQRLLFKDYEVDVEEKPCVSGGLTSMQLKKLVLILERLRSVAGGRGWGTHELMVEAVEKRVLALLGVTNSCGGRVEVD